MPVTSTPATSDAQRHSRLETAARALERNNFTTHVAADSDQARQIILKDILPDLNPAVVSYGDSMTLQATRVLDVFRVDATLRCIDTFEPGVPREEIIERRRRALLADLFFTGSNAVTLDGKLVNLDMVGNRVAGLVFGPRHVVVVVGRNKIVPDLAAAMDRIKHIAAPANAVRHHVKTPCAKTGRCMDCKSPGRICNVWTITEKSFPKHRIHVVLIEQDLGL